MANKGLIALAVGALVAVPLILIRRKAKAAPPEEIPEDALGIRIANPPAGGTMWSIRLTDWDKTTLIDFVGKNGVDRLDIAEAAVFEIPYGLQFPLLVADLSIKKWKDDIEGGTIQYVYSVQSYRPTNPFTDEPDPTYRDISIPGIGSYHYNVASETFE